MATGRFFVEEQFPSATPERVDERRHRQFFQIKRKGARKVLS
jgi:hypothetical protein